jgi:hypothetical protein
MDMRKAIASTKRMLAATDVTFGSMYILYCEARQAVAKYGRRGVSILLQLAVSEVGKKAADRARIRNQVVSGGQSHTVRILEAIRRSAMVSIPKLRRMKCTRVLPLHRIPPALAKGKLCEKVRCSMIPEVQRLIEAMKQVSGGIGSKKARRKYRERKDAIRVSRRETEKRYLALGGQRYTRTANGEPCKRRRVSKEEMKEYLITSGR